jgi:predicted ArsR family transcriptional regulator
VIPSGHVRLDALASLASLDEPVRRQLYEHVSDQRRPVAREEAAEAIGITRTLAAYHLDKLVEAGLLVCIYQRPAGRRCRLG